MAQWNIDSYHSGASFSVRHMMVTTVRGGFQKVSGTLNFDPANPAAASVEADIDAASISTGVNDRDNHLRSADFLDAANFPTLHFKSTGVTLTGDNTADITGDLTIRDVTRPVVIKGEFLGTHKGMDGQDRAGFTGTTRINREDFGLTWNVALEAGGWLVGKEVTIALDVEAVPVKELATA